MTPAVALLDSSVLLRLIVDHADELQSQADLLADAIEQGRLEPLLLDLGLYEILNVMTGKMMLDPETVTAQLRDIFGSGWPIVTLDAELAYRTVEIAADSGLTGYDAAFVSAAEQLGVPLITADAAMVEAVGSSALALWEIA